MVTRARISGPNMDLTIALGNKTFLLVDSGSSQSAILNNSISSAIPFVVYPVNCGDTITQSVLEDFRSHILEQDDIFSPQFLTHILFYGSQEDEVNLQSSAISILQAWNTRTWKFTAAKKDSPALNPGPYVSFQGKVWEPWRIYKDDHLTMTLTFKPTKGGTDLPSLEELDNTLTANQLRIVVPPRSYFSTKKMAGKPLLGVRLAVKDVFDIKGFPTSLCNRAWSEYYGAKSATAPAIEILQKLGAIIIGKTRLNAMLVREETMECVEFLAPYNPRGDGYQTSSGSSSGSCAALAAYPWVDYTIGSDTNGSSRKPAYWNGCFGIRPTHGVLDTTGVASFCPYYDVPAFFGRDISLFRHFASLWFGESSKLKSSSNSTPWKRILYPTDYLPTKNNEQTKVIESFVRDMEELLGIRRTRISLANLWCQNQTQSIDEADLTKFLETAATLPYYKDAFDKLASFFEGYQAKFGKMPFIHRALRWRREVVADMTPEKRQKGWDRIYTYRKWLLENIFQDGSVLVLPIEDGKPSYRDATPPPYGLLSGFSPLYVSPIAGTPEVTAPIGELFYYSEISQRDEPLPISVSVVSPPGTDLDLIDLVHSTLKQNEKPVRVETGRSLFSAYIG